MTESIRVHNQVRPVSPSRGVLRPLGLDEVAITGGFWGQKQQLNATHIIRHCAEWIEKMGWVANFEAAVEGRLPQAHTGMMFADSDVYKVIEAMAWEIGRTGDDDLERKLNALVARIEPAQEADGYLNTVFGRPGQPARYSNLEWGHELYCFGHLIQAAIARGRTRVSAHGEDRLVAIARRAADHVCEAFGADGIQRVCGHPEIEVALAEFARFTGERKYLEQARLFVERRGHGTLGPISLGQGYFQDDVPVRDTEVMSGHAVRALYLAAGAVDVAVETGDDELLHRLIAQTARTVARRTYVTGGMGAHHEGEAFGLDYELPPDRAYSETCAGVGSVMVNHRLLLATGDLSYGDVIERTLYNVVVASPAADGEAFFYTNTLHQRVPGVPPSTDSASPRAASSLRAPWFEVSCCPPNVARTLASLAGYVATSDAAGVQIHQYADSRISTTLENGTAIALNVSTGYPATGGIRVESTSPTPAEWTLTLRVPAWAGDGAMLSVNGEKRPAPAGAVEVARTFAQGDVVELELPVAPRWTWPHPRVDAVRGSVAVERGPLVMCVESVDLAEGADVDDIRVDTSSAPLDDDGVTSVMLARDVQEHDASGGVLSSWPYTSHPPTADRTVARATHLIPYHQWANRGSSTMRVWLPVIEN